MSIEADAADAGAECRRLASFFDADIYLVSNVELCFRNLHNGEQVGRAKRRKALVGFSESVSPPLAHLLR